ncbi:B12-dependent methionine synthase [Escherichia coli]|uniref:B12-dependent methionine synthase n=1 Tax=Escherichia coli TaxID=562 RepID=A0A376MN20_ECOLX|nr:B12-dependent methionine synthase [Escherichia coli]
MPLKRSTMITTKSWVKALADRLAEAFAEYLHERVA